MSTTPNQTPRPARRRTQRHAASLLAALLLVVAVGAEAKKGRNPPRGSPTNSAQLPTVPVTTALADGQVVRWQA